MELTLSDDSYLFDYVTGFSSGDLITIIGNLLDNAMEACLSKEEKFVDILIQGDKHYLYIEVQDNGAGIQKPVERIFDYGFTTKNKAGHGIGLALVKQIVESNHGTIQVFSEVGVGTTMIVQVGRNEQ